MHGVKHDNSGRILVLFAILLLGLFAGQYMLERSFRIPYLECRFGECLWRTIYWSLVAAGAAIGLGIFFKRIIAGGRRNPSRVLVWTIGIILVLICIKIPPVGTQDPYWNMLLAKGWVSQGLNPYRTTPVVMSEDPLYRVLDSWKDSPMTHGPLWVGIVGAAIRIGGNIFGALLLLKILAGGVVILTAWIAGRMAAPGDEKVGNAGRTAAIAAILWNPFILEQAVVNLHADIYMGLAVLAGAYFSSRNKNAYSAACLTFGALIKYVSGILIIIPLWQEIARPGSLFKKTMRGFKVFLISTGIFWAVSAGLGFGPADIISALEQEARNRMSLGFGWFWTEWLTVFLRTPSMVRLLSLVAMSAAAAWLTARKNTGGAVYALPLLILFLLSPWFMPWYALWLLPVLAAGKYGYRVFWWSAVFQLMNGLMNPIFVSAVLLCLLPVWILRPSLFNPANILDLKSEDR